MPLASIEPMALQSPGKAAHPGQGVHMNLVWQLAAKTLLSEETGHSFRLNIQAPRTETPLPYLSLTDMSRNPHSPLGSLHPLLLTAISSGKETVSLPPAVQRKPFQPSSAADYGSPSPFRSTCPQAKASWPGPHHLLGSRVSVFVHICLAAQGQAFGPTTLVPV